MLLKALLADDEPNILRNLKTVIPWEALQFEVVGLARNGMQALELVREHEPDLILSDIRMPGMDGIAFIEELRSFDGHSEVLMITGYQEFEYARSLLKLGVSDYIVKPIDYEELAETIGKLGERIRAKKRSKQVRDKRWTSVANLAYEKILHDVLQNYASVQPIYALAEEEADLEQFRYSVLLVDLDGYAQLSLGWDDKERKLWSFAVRNVLQEALSAWPIRYIVLQLREGEWCALVERGKDAPPPTTEECLRWGERLQQEVAVSVKLPVSVAVYPGHVQLGELAQVYKKLQRSMQLRKTQPKALLVCRETEHDTDPGESIWLLTEDLVMGLKQSDGAKTDKALLRLDRIIQSVPEESFERVRPILHFVALHLMREMREIRSIAGEAEERIWRKLELVRSIPDMFDVIGEIVRLALDAAAGRKTSETLMVAAEDYMLRRLGDDFGTQDIADALGISPSYFSLLFKQKHGETFLEHLTKLRMERAKSLLLHSDKNVAQIALAVGFAERRYFTKVFQKHTGELPSEYRDSRKGTAGGNE
ncbi:response regulator [Paenibacillus contaminans]|uniref:Two-component system response regulator n=1 Tax=Paenibacillus contaminans TaxID=450362 RepID=A0A329MQV4_9BACL|nr:response regulator [Paenibacillus contaminans]RAV21900.1 two-component system response regulator [Paenibacillus contaminans]